MKKDIRQDNKITEENCSEQIERNKEILDLVNSYIVAADTKVSILSGVFSAVFAVIMYLTDKVFSDRILIEEQKYACLNKIYIISICLALLLFILSLLFTVLAVSPKLDKASKNRKGKYSIFYAEIADFEDAKSFSNCAKESTKSNYNEELLNEIYLNSSICTKKMKNFRISLWLSFISITIEIFSSTLYFLITVQ